MQKFKKTQHLLVVDDDVKIRNLLQKYLIENNYFVSIAKNAQEANEVIQNIKCDLIILDVMMPGETGFEFTKRNKSNKFYKTPILMLTAMGEIEDRIKGLEIGADDYLVKPFEPKELLLRISKIIQREQKQSGKYYFGDFIYDKELQSLSQNNQQIILTTSEHILLNYFLEHVNKIITREELSKELKINERSVDVQIIRLRGKIELNPSRPTFLQTIRGQGYIIRPF